MDNIVYKRDTALDTNTGGADDGGGGAGGLIRTTINNGFVFATNTFNLDSNRFNSIGQTSSSSSDISGGNSEFHFRNRYPNDLHRHDFEWMNGEKPCEYAATANFNTQIPPTHSAHSDNGADRRVKTNIVPNGVTASNIYEHNRLLSIPSKPIWLQKSSGNTVM